MDLANIIKDIRQVNNLVDPEECLPFDNKQVFDIDVRRDCFVKDAIKTAKKKKFDPKKLIKVYNPCYIIIFYCILNYV